MNSTTLKLVRLQLDNEFELFRSKNVKNIVFNILKSILLLGVIFYVIMTLLKKFATLGFYINTQLLGILIMVCQLITLVFSIFRIINKLYTSKDNEFLIVLPCNANQLFISKMLLIYVEEVLISSLYVLPILLSVGIIAKFVWWYFALIPVILIILPLLPIAIASLVSIPIAMVTRVVKRNVVGTLVTTLVLFAVAIIVYTNIITLFTKDFGMANLAQQIRTISKINDYMFNWAEHSLLYYPLCKSFCDAKYFYWFLIYLSIGIVTSICTLYIIKPFYFKAMQSSLESQSSTITGTSSFKGKTPFQSMLLKEMYSIFRSNNYTIQFLLFTLLMPVIVACYDSFILQISVGTAGATMILGSHILTFGIVAMLSNLMSATTISREGASFYYMKIVPNNFYKQIWAKLCLNLILTSLAILVTSVVSLFYFEWYKVLLSSLVVWLGAVGHACYSLDLDVKEPNLKWYGFGEMNVVSKNATKSIIMGLIVAFVMGVYVILTANFNQVLVWALLIIGVLAFALRKLYVLGVRISYKFMGLEV